MTCIRTKLRLTALLCLLFLTASCVLAAMPLTTAKAAAGSTSTVPAIFDNADLLTSDEEEMLTLDAQNAKLVHNVNFLIVTVDETGDDTENYSESFYKNFVSKYGDAESSCVILTIDMGFRYADVSGQGAAKERMDSDRCDKVFSKISSDLSSGDYFGACSKFISVSSDYLRYRSGVDPDALFFKFWFQLVLTAGICVLSTFGLVARVGTRMTVDRLTYLDRTHSSMPEQRDQFIRTITTRTYSPVPKDTGSSHGGGGGFSGGGGGGGGSHGGGHF